MDPAFSQCAGHISKVKTTFETDEMFSNLSSSKCSSAPFNSPCSSVRDSDITDIWWWLLQHHPWSIYKSKICTRIFNQPATRPTYMPDPQQPISKKCVWWTLYRIHVTESKKCMLQNCPLDNVQLIFRKKRGYWTPLNLLPKIHTWEQFKHALQ